MLSISSGHSAAYLTGQVGAGRESYYTGAVTAGEPPGRWWGRGARPWAWPVRWTPRPCTPSTGRSSTRATRRSLRSPRGPCRPYSGAAPKQFRTPEQVVEDRIGEYTAEHADAPTPEQVQAWRIEAERAAPKAVGFFDLTFSPDKSVTVLHTAFVRAAHEAHVARRRSRGASSGRAPPTTSRPRSWTPRAAGLDYIERTAAYTRIGRHGPGGSGRWDDAQGLTVARFLQHTSRDLDPQLHVHQAVLNKVQGSDGAWRALDGKTLHAARPGAAAISERELEAQLTRRLGITWEMRPDGLGRRVAGIDPVLEDLFSSRRHAITAEAEHRLTAFEATIGRPANAVERTRILQAATLVTRRAKTHVGESEAEQYARWQAEAETAIAGGLTRQAEAIAQRLAGADPGTEAAEAFSPEAVIAEALEAAHGDTGRSTLTRHELIRRLDLALPANLGALPAGRVADLLEEFADKALSHADVVQTGGHEIGHAPSTDRLANGRSQHHRPGLGHLRHPRPPRRRDRRPAPRR